MIETTLHERIAHARKLAKLTQQETGELLNLERSTIASWESGKTEPSPSKIITLASTLGVSWIWLFSGEGHEKDHAALLGRTDEVAQNYINRITPDNQKIALVKDSLEVIALYESLPPEQKHHARALLLNIRVLYPPKSN